jgi:hypothetical protein
MASPSIIPTDRLDRDMYLVLEDFSSGPAWRETDEDRTDYRTLISDLLTGQYDHPLRVVAFNPLEGWSRDASEDVAQELELRISEGHEVAEPVREFIERFTASAHCGSMEAATSADRGSTCKATAVTTAKSALR